MRLRRSRELCLLPARTGHLSLVEDTDTGGLGAPGPERLRSGSAARRCRRPGRGLARTARALPGRRRGGPAVGPAGHGGGRPGCGAGCGAGAQGGAGARGGRGGGAGRHTGLPGRIPRRHPGAEGEEGTEASAAPGDSVGWRAVGCGTPETFFRCDLGLSHGSGRCRCGAGRCGAGPERGRRRC